MYVRVVCVCVAWCLSGVYECIVYVCGMLVCVSLRCVRVRVCEVCE